MDERNHTHLPAASVAANASVAGAGPNPVLLDILDADLAARDPYVANARCKITARGAAHAAAHAELLLNSLEATA